MPTSKKWLNGTFLNASKKAVANGDLTKSKGSYKLTADFKKKGAAAAKPKKAPKKKAAPNKKAAPKKKKTAPKTKVAVTKKKPVTKKATSKKKLIYYN